MIADLKPYADYKDSGLPWLGKVPAHWRTVRNGSLFGQRSQTGYGELPILEVSLKTGVQVRSFGQAGRKQIMSDLGKYKRAVKGDLAYNTMRMWQGALGVCPVDGLVSPAYVVARTYPNVNAGYFAALFRTGDYMAEIDSASRGIVKDRNRLYWDQFKQMQSPCPPLDEQAAIMRFLDWANGRLERTIMAKRRVIALLKEKLQVQVQQIVSHGLRPAAALKESGSHWFAGIPQDWDMVRSGSVFRLFGGYAFPGTGLVRDESETSLPILLTPVNFDPDGGLRFGIKSTVRFQGSFPGQFSLRKGDLVTVLTDLSSKRLILGRAGFVDHDRLLLNQRTARIDIHPNVRQRLIPEYLCWVLNSEAVREQTIATSRGSTVFHTSPTRMLAAVWPLPPISQQVDLVDKLNDLQGQYRAQRDSLRNEIELLGEYRARLVADVVTGRLDVRSAASCVLEEVALDSNAYSIDEPDDPELITEETEA